MNLYGLKYSLMANITSGNASMQAQAFKRQKYLFIILLFYKKR